MKDVNHKIVANGIEIRVSTKINREDYISLTDIAKYKSDSLMMLLKIG